MCNKSESKEVCPSCDYEIEADEQLRQTDLHTQPICDVCISDMSTGYSENANGY